MSTDTTNNESAKENGNSKDGNNENINNDNDKTTIPEGHELIHEGSITMLYPKSENSVFYNPVQVQNRDLSVLMLGMYAERRMERQWISKTRKEVRKEMLQKQHEEKEKEEGKEDTKKKKTKETKEERKARNAQFESDLEARVAERKSKVNFTSQSSQSPDGMSVFEALAASGLRSLRYWKEVPGIRTIVVNDLDPVAVDMARENVVRNGLKEDLVTDSTEESNNNDNEQKQQEKQQNEETIKHNLRPPGIHLQVGDATHEMYISRLPPKLYPHQITPTQRLHQKPQYDVIDLDPYGSAAPFLDAALQSIVHGGLLAVTCTDMAALGGSHPETCYGRYGAMPLQRSGYLQELALRILLYHMSVIAGRYGRTIRPVLSVGMAFYCRVFVEVYDDKAGVNNLSLSHGHLFQSTKCSTFHVTPMATNAFVTSKQQSQSDNNNNIANSDNNGANNKGRNKKNRASNVYRNGRGPCDLGEPVCGETGASYKIAGPLWTGPLHDMDIVNDAISRLEAAESNKGIHPTAGASPLHPLHTATTLHGMLVSVSEELPDVPLYHCLPTLCSAVNSPTIPLTTFKAALINAGYRVSAYHKEPNAIKTNAPNSVVWDIVRAWCKEHPPAKRKESKRHRKGEAQGSNAPATAHDPADIAARILAKEIQTKGIDFDTIPKELLRGERKKAKRWALNPEANWGPKKAASGRNKKRKLEEDDNDVENVDGKKNEKEEEDT
eukprot:CAMPEP_0183718872 /NCGR_PEP_ID=MMETSP0737-20130205/12014_1 /TAXON_ID=385413 /ORGANISM="Thalassiosira miniscula, Strain CCMP1093" /LENGTH=723 /DNA_ID=CAMNT_0025948515 /DNA_START=131 /DNA_END=2302 /DNA_ORIENTATION=-